MAAGVTISGQKELLAKLAQEAGVTFPEKMSVGLREASAYVEAAAKSKVAPHHWQGSTEAGIHAYPPVILPDGSVTVEVGSDSPQARAIEAGWYSSGGHQPPADALAAWASSRGIQPAPGQTPAGLGFVMARAIGAYSGGAKAKADIKASNNRLGVRLGLVPYQTAPTGDPGNRYGFAMGPLKYLIKAVQRTNQKAILEILIRALQA